MTPEGKLVAYIRRRVRELGGEIRYHAELSCVELDAMAREEVDNERR